MDRRDILRGSAAACAATVGLAIAAPAAAQDGKADVDKVGREFEEALSVLDINRMMAIWSQDADTILLNPRDKEPASGAAAVRKRWEETFGFWKSLKVSSKGSSTVHISGNAAYRFVVENVEGTTKDGRQMTFLALVTTTFEKKGNAWQIACHHASAMPS